MPLLDFQAALGRLLCDGQLRDAFREDREAVVRQLNVIPDDRADLLALAPEELEIQADILLHKRFERVRTMLPDTCGILAEEAWPSFRRYGRFHWVKIAWPEKDALGFCEFLVARRLVSRGISELNRVLFSGTDRRLEIRFVRDASVAGRKRSGLQILMRSQPGYTHELAIGIAL